MTGSRFFLLWMAVLLVLPACAAPAGLGGSGRDGQAGLPVVGPKRIAAAIQSDPPSLYPALNPSSIRGGEVIAEMANSGLAVLDNKGSLLPRLAEAVPSLDNGFWKILPDGTAETTWKLRDSIKWHDGAPFSSADLVFTANLLLDRELALTRAQAFDFVNSIEAPDARTIVVKWKAPYVDADRMFTRGLAFPVAKHVLEGPYQRDKASLLGHPYWSTEYVGTGPFKLKDWVLGSHMVFAANDAYVFGRPKLDEVEVKFIPDPNTVFASVLGGGVDLTLGKTVAIEQAIEAQTLWRDGRIDSAPGNAVVMRIQFLYTSPPIVGQVPFRKAIEHAVDRQQMVDSLLSGLAPIGDTSLFSALEPTEFLPARDQVVRYPYDPRRSMQLIESLGYTRGADGFYRDAAGQKISVEIRTNIVDLNQKATLTVSDFWKQVGIEGVPEFFPQSRATDQEYRAKFPAFELLRGLDLDGLDSFHSRQRKTAENGWRGGNGGYGNPEYDAMVDRYAITIPIKERVDLLGQLLRHISDQVVVSVLFWDIEPIMIGNRIHNVFARHRSSSHGWNSHEWDLF